MRFLLRYFILFVIFACITREAIAQGTTSKGTEFYTSWMDHKNGAGGNTGSQMNLYITSDVNTTGNVELADGTFSQSFTVTANQVTTVAIPISAFLGNTSGSLPGKGIHITAALPVAVYAHIYASNVSGATLLLPVSTLGKDYISINYIQKDPTNKIAGGSAFAYSTIDIVATDDNTSVQITPAATLTGGQAANVPFPITLAKKGDVYQCESATDLTGSVIKSVSINNDVCKPIAVFSGSSKITIDAGTSGDNLFQQVYPTSAWGKNFVTVPLASRTHDEFRIIVTDPNTIINGLQVPATPAILAKGYLDFSSTIPLYITADKPIQVVQYAVTQSGDIGDPEMIFLNPIEQGLDHVTLYSTGEYRIANSFINVVIPTDAASSFILDGQPLPLTVVFKTLPANTNYSYAQIPVTSGLIFGQTGADKGTHNISASRSFNAIAYGFGNVESYGYSAGTNLADFSKFITLQTPATGPVTAAGCSDLNYQLSLTLPLIISSITWDFHDGTPTVVEPVTPSAPFLNNGVLEYTYNFAATKRFAAGVQNITASYINPTVDCGQESFSYQVTIADPPIANFTFSKVCLGDATAFQYTGTADATNTYKWDFNDGKTSTDVNPTHTYASPGDYNVVLTVVNSSGCATVSPTQIVHVSKKPFANFTTSSPDCANTDITFTDKSFFPEGYYAVSSWDFGDASPLEISQNPHHIYASPGKYTVILTVTNDKGCTSDVYKADVIVHSTPAASFTSPDVCLSDITTTFTSTSKIDDKTESGFTYVWDFDDGSPITPTLAKSITHQYAKVGIYNPKLKVISTNGCESPVATNQLVVNKSNPKTAAYNLITVPPLCSENAVVIEDASEAEAGDFISKIEINWGDGTTDTYPRAMMHADKRYSHNYALFSNPMTLTFPITETAYTGGTCNKVSNMPPIVINANPVVVFPAFGPVCQEAYNFQIAGNTGGFTGVETFTGTGVTATGKFEPLKAIIGDNVIHYTFTADVTGCTYITDLHITVNPTPKASAGPDHTFLDGSQVTLEATASPQSNTNTLIYKWTPSTGLDHDDVLNPVASPTDNTKYTLTVTSVPDGCSVSSATNVYVLKLPVIPNTFTPNNDGYNDVWTIQYLDNYKDATIEIFSRNGEKVFSSVGYSIPWDGRYNGNDLPAGVYYYIINPKHNRKTMAGYVTILR